MQDFFRYLLKNNRPLKVIIWLVIFSLYFFVFYTFIEEDEQKNWFEYGRTSADISLVLLAVALMPGLMGRFRVTGVVKDLKNLLLILRRQIGLCTFAFAFAHYLWIKLFITIEFKLDLLQFTYQELAGAFALSLLTIMAFTSMDYFIRLFTSRWWHRLHRIVYIAIWLIFLHLILNDNFGTYTLLVFTLGILEILSWIYYYSWKNKPAITPAPVSTSMPTQS